MLPSSNAIRERLEGASSSSLLRTKCCSGRCARTRRWANSRSARASHKALTESPVSEQVCAAAAGVRGHEGGQPHDSGHQRRPEEARHHRGDDRGPRQNPVPGRDQHRSAPTSGVVVLWVACECLVMCGLVRKARLAEEISISSISNGHALGVTSP